MKVSIILFIYILMLLTSCKKSDDSSGEINSSKTRMIKKIFVINDSVISRRDPAEVIAPLWYSINIYGSKEEYEKDLEPYSLHQRSIFALMWYMSEVNNGGHYQFYTNSTGIVWEDAKEGFRLIGLPEGMEIIEESAKRFGNRPGYGKEERENYLVKNNIDFEDLDDKFYELDSKLNITKAASDFIEKNKRQFYFKGEIEVPKEREL